MNDILLVGASSGFYGPVEQNSVNDIRGYGYGRLRKYEDSLYVIFCTRPTGEANLLMFQQFIETSTNLRLSQICVFVDTAGKVRR